MATASQATGNMAGVKSRSKIISQALELFAKKGIDAVSMRQIALASGQSNVAAIQYHFGNKDQLLAEVLNDINSQFRKIRNEAYKELEKNKNHLSREDVPAIILATITPALMMLQQGGQSALALKLMSRMVAESGTRGRAVVTAVFADDIRRVHRLLCCALPNANPEQLKRRVMFAVTNVIHGIAESDSFYDSALGDLTKYDPDTLPSIPEDFVQFLAGGITAGI